MTKATESVADRRQRQQIREAMSRLIDGTALSSDGKLTIKSLAEAAQVKRWVLTHRHTDLQAEFRAKIADTTGNQPPALRKLQDAHAEAEEKVQNLRVELADLKATLRQYERVVQVLALENHQLKNPETRGQSATLSAVPSTTTRPRRTATQRRPTKPCS
jgi:thioredoxin-like negative regulator of GroEL